MRIAFTVAPMLFGVESAGNIVDLLIGGYGDIALRDFGLLLGALTLSRLAGAFPGRDASAAQRH